MQRCLLRKRLRALVVRVGDLNEREASEPDAEQAKQRSRLAFVHEGNRDDADAHGECHRLEGKLHQGGCFLARTVVSRCRLRFKQLVDGRARVYLGEGRREEQLR